MIIKVQLKASGKIGYIERTFGDGPNLEYYLQFRFEDIGNFVGGYYKLESFDVIGVDEKENIKIK